MDGSNLPTPWRAPTDEEPTATSLAPLAAPPSGDQAPTPSTSSFEKETEPYLPTPGEELRLTPWRRPPMSRFAHKRPPAYSYGSLGQRKVGQARLAQSSFANEASKKRIGQRRVIFVVFALAAIVGVVGAILLASTISSLVGGALAPATAAPGVSTITLPTLPATTRTPAIAPGGGYLSGALAPSPSQANLTTLANTNSSDWAHWGLTSPTDFNHRATGNSQISTYTLIGGAQVGRYDAANVAYSWSDGQPTASVSNVTCGIYVRGAGNGFSLTLPADTTTRTLTVYVGAYRAQAVFTASLSDDSASQYTDSSLGATTGEIDATYTITYQAASANQQLTIMFSMQTSYVSDGYIALQAATLN